MDFVEGEEGSTAVAKTKATTLKKEILATDSIAPNLESTTLDEVLAVAKAF